MSSIPETYADFTKLAKQYCSLLEVSIANEKIDLYAIRSHLLGLYAAAIELPPVDVGNIEVAKGVEREEASALFKQLQTLLPFNYYWDKFNPLEDKDENHITSSLADDLADIWRDLERGLRALKAHPDRSKDVWWDWRFNFHFHWGAHAIGALRALHYALQDKYD